MGFTFITISEYSKSQMLGLRRGRGTHTSTGLTLQCYTSFLWHVYSAAHQCCAVHLCCAPVLSRLCCGVRAKQLALYHIPTAVYMVVFIIGLIWAGLGSIWAADCSTGKVADCLLLLLFHCCAVLWLLLCCITRCATPHVLNCYPHLPPVHVRRIKDWLWATGRGGNLRSDFVFDQRLYVAMLFIVQVTPVSPV